MFTLPKLPYAYTALKPVISEDIMRLHHDKHHQAYVDKLNQALEGRDVSDDLEYVLRHLDDLPDVIRTTVRNNGGGHYNHSQFWQWLAPAVEQQPGELTMALLKKHHGSFAQFVDKFTTSALGLFGSGWVWLQPNLDIITTANQDSPIMDGQPAPILGLDVWEHAYYLDYENRRDAYVNKWWKVANWEEAEKRFLA